MTVLIDQLNEQAWQARNQSISETKQKAKQAHKLALKENYQQGLADSSLCLAYCQFKQADFSTALETIQSTYKQYNELNDTRGMQRSLNTLGMIYGQSGDFSNALKAFLETYKLCQTINDQEAEANALNNLGLIHTYLADYHTALDHHLQSLEIYEQLEAKQGEIKTLKNIGLIYYELSRYNDALQYFEMALKKLELYSDEPTYALTLLNLGRALQKLGQNEKALEYQTKSLEQMERLNDPLGVSSALYTLGDLYLSQQDYAKAQTHLDRSLSIRKDLGDSKGEVETSLQLGELLVKQGNYQDATNYFETGLTLAKQISAKATIYKTHRQFATALKQQGKYKDALEHLEDHIVIKDDLFNETSDQRFQALRVSYDLQQSEKEKEIYRLKNVELAAANKRLQELSDKLERQAIEDPLTKLYNRRHFEAVLHSTYVQSCRYQQAMSLMICDIDDFKSVNDTFSHAVGDEVLRQVARLFTQTIREADTVARYGGEEFVVLFPETSVDNAAIICDRIRAIIQNHPWHEIAPELKVTVSLGLCDDTSLGSGETMITKADDALYSAKRNGKNHVCIWHETGITLANIADVAY